MKPGFMLGGAALVLLSVHLAAAQTPWPARGHQGAPPAATVDPFIAQTDGNVLPVGYSQADPQSANGPPSANPPTPCDDCPCCHCAPCECPQTPAPCQPCPHISTVSPYWNLNIFGALQGNMLFSTAR